MVFLLDEGQSPRPTSLYNPQNATVYFPCTCVSACKNVQVFPVFKGVLFSLSPCYFQHQPLQRGVILPISVSSNHRMNLSSVPQHLSKNVSLPHLRLCKHLNPLAAPFPSLLNSQQTSHTWFSSHPSDCFLTFLCCLLFLCFLVKYGFSRALSSALLTLPMSHLSSWL